MPDIDLPRPCNCPRRMFDDMRGHPNTGKRGPPAAWRQSRSNPPRKPTRRHARASGFSLLETIVALAIFAAGAMALYGLFNTNIIALERVRATTEHLPAARNAIEVLSTVNPWRSSEGVFEVGGYQVNWAARLIEPIRNGQTPAGTMSGYDYGLYEIEFVIADGRRRLGEWRMRSVGYERVRNPISME